MKTLIIYVLILLYSHRHVSASGAASDLIHQTCKNSSTADPNIPYSFCVSALQSAPTARCAAFQRLGLLSLRLLNDNVTDTRCRVKLLVKDRSSSLVPAAEESAPLEDCLDLYSDAVTTLKEAVADYKEGNYYDANVKVSAVMDAAVTCEDGFRDGGVRSPLTRWNGFAFRLSSISLYIINLLRAPLI